MVNNNAARHLLFIASILLCIFGYVGYKLNRGKNPRYDAPVNQFASHQPAPPAAAVSVAAPPAQASTRPAAPPATKPLPPPQDDDLGEWVPSARGEELALTPAPAKPLAPPPAAFRPPQDDFAATPHAGVITGLIPAPPSAGPTLRPDPGSLPPSGLPIPNFAGGNGAPSGAAGVPAASSASSASTPSAASSPSLPPAAQISGLKPPSEGPPAYPAGDVAAALPSAGVPGLPFGGSDEGFDDSDDLASAGLPPLPYASGLPDGSGAVASQEPFPGAASLPPPSGLPAAVTGSPARSGDLGPPPAALPPRSGALPPGGGLPGAAATGGALPAPAAAPGSAMRPGIPASPRPPVSGPASGPNDIGMAGGSASLPTTRTQAAPASGITVPGIPPASPGPRGPSLPPPAARQEYNDYGNDDTYGAAAVSGSESLRVYVVLPGDTLSSIAARELGSISLADNIFLLNRDVIADPDHLLAGVKIRLPVRENGQSQLVPAPSGLAGAGRTPPPPAPAGSGPRTHVVARGETLSSISTYYYGTSSGWRFIADSNKKSLPNPNQLAVGVELTIPPFEEMKR